MIRSSLTNIYSVFSVLVLTSFWLIYSYLCFHAKWGGDVYVYVAAISEVFRNYPHLLLEAGQQPARESIAFTPYLISLALVGKRLSFSPYETLQLAGLINCFLFPAATFYFFASIYPRKNALIPSALFILILIFIRGENYFWSSELSAETLSVIQAYPSFFAWSLAMFCFGLCQRLLGATTVVGLATLGILIWIVFLTHNITGSWIVLVIAFFGLAQMALSIRAKQFSPIFRALACLIVIGSALLATLAWPYSSILGNLELVALQFNDPFSGKPLASFPFLYLLSIPAYCWCWRHFRRLAITLLIGFVVTFAAYEVLQLVSGLFERYVFFLAFFPQVLIAVVLADNIERLLAGQRQNLSKQRLGFFERSFIVVYPIAFLAVLIASAAMRGYSGVKLSRDSRATFEDRFPRLVGALSQSDVVAQCPITPLTLFLFSKTGARFVLPSSSLRGQTRIARQTDLDALFNNDRSSQSAIDEILQRYGITKALVHPDCSAVPFSKSFFSGRLRKLVTGEGGWSIYVVPETKSPER